MNRDQVLAACRALPKATEGFPFGDQTLVFRIGGRLFALVHVGAGPATISLKCDPGYAVAMRQQYPSVTPGYHLNKRHWNTVQLDGSIGTDLLSEWIGDSYELAMGGLTRAQRAALA